MAAIDLQRSEPVRPALTIRYTYAQALRPVAAAVAVGAALGFVIGGVVSRLAMRALFLTTGPHVAGRISDDGFPIGRFDPAATLNLLVVGTVIGIIGAFVYLAVRPFLMGPAWLRCVGCALGAGMVVGAMLVHTTGIDFIILEPRWFAVGLFVAIPALFGLLAPPAIEGAMRPDGWFQTARAKLALIPLLVFVFPPLLLLVGLPTAAVVGGYHLVQRSPGASRVAHHVATMSVLRIGFVAVGLAGLWSLVQDVRFLL